MAYDDPQDNRDQIPPPPPPRRSVDDEGREADLERRSYQPQQPTNSGCSKGCLYGLAGCGCLTVILAIVAGFAAFQFFKNALSTDPVVVTATAKEIADFDLPPDLKPAAKFDMLGLAKFVIFVSENGDSSLMIAQVDPKKFPGGNAQGFNFDNNQQQGQRKLETTKSEQREMKVRGENAKVTFAEAKDLDTGIEYRVVKGRFQGKSGPAQFELQIPKEKYKEEDAVKFVETFK